MKKIIKYFSVILFSAFFMIILSSNPISALYDSSKNTTTVSVTKDRVQIEIRYQKGINQGSAVYQWCKGTLNSISECVDPKGPINYIESGGDQNLNYIAMGDAADDNVTRFTFIVEKNKDPILSDLANLNGQNYTLFVTTNFCARRSGSNGVYTGCEYWDPDISKLYTKLHVSMDDLQNGLFIGATDGEIADDGINSMMTKIEDIVNGTVMPILWAVLGLFLVIKGTITGVQIVKSADEPQVRQEKIGSLKWLVIGVAIAYGATFAVSVVLSFFENTFQGGK